MPVSIHTYIYHASLYRAIFAGLPSLRLRNKAQDRYGRYRYIDHRDCRAACCAVNGPSSHLHGGFGDECAAQ